MLQPFQALYRFFSHCSLQVDPSQQRVIFARQNRFSCLPSLLFSLLLLGLSPTVAAQNPNLIPLPQQFSYAEPTYNLSLNRFSLIQINPNYRDLLNPFVEQLQRDLPVASGEQQTANIYLSIQPDLGPEAYQIDTRREEVSLHAGDAAGLFYGIQTLLQLLEGDRWQACSLRDAPRFAWRGMHLDVSRHFFSLPELKRYIDLLAMYKMNTFHWHLTDDQGWRIEIKKYPRLTEVGAFRSETLIGRPSAEMQYDGRPYGGFYTQAEVRELVAYAAARHITIVPEIEMPGHSLAALAAYPQFACTPGPFAVARSWGVFEDVYCAGKDATFDFLTDVLDEVMDLFPGPYLHIGGDECPKTRWNACAACGARMQAEGLADAHELQSYFIQRMERHVNARGRKIIGWDEILEGGLAPNAAVMSWRGTDGGIAAAQAGHYAVMSPGNPCYFDHYQAQPTADEPLAICCYNPLEAVYAYEPVPAALSATEATFILGAQGNVWTEYMPDFDQVTYMALPRMAALAEVLWTQPARRSYPDFLHRLRLHSRELDARGYRYAPHFKKTD